MITEIINNESNCEQDALIARASAQYASIILAIATERYAKSKRRPPKKKKDG